MQLYMKQRLLSFKQDFDIYNRQGEPVFHVDNEFFSFGLKFYIYNVASGEEAAYVEQKLWSFLPTMHIFIRDEHVASIVKSFTFFKPKYEVHGLAWQIEGDIFEHNYSIVNQAGNNIAQIQKRFLSWSDTFEFNIREATTDPTMVIAVILAIDAVMDSQD